MSLLSGVIDFDHLPGSLSYHNLTITSNSVSKHYDDGSSTMIDRVCPHRHAELSTSVLSITVTKQSGVHLILCSSNTAFTSLQPGRSTVVRGARTYMRVLKRGMVPLPYARRFAA